MKARTAILIIFLIILIDQALKFYIKLNFHHGESINMFGKEQDWAQFMFVENEGMAWGWKLGGNWGKILLTSFRLVAVIWGVFLIRGFIRKNMNKWFILCACLIYAGALGNLIDSLFYGLIFDHTYVYGNYASSEVVAKAFTGHGYGHFFLGKVVDMFYFPMIKVDKMPDWIPFLGGDSFTFFSAIFNVADAAISVGVIALLIFQNKFFGDKKEEPKIEEMPASV